MQRVSLLKKLHTSTLISGKEASTSDYWPYGKSTQFTQSVSLEMTLFQLKLYFMNLHYFIFGVKYNRTNILYYTKLNSPKIILCHFHDLGFYHPS